MDFKKVYHDLDDNECNILQMVKREPEWAANRIQEGERAIEDLKLNASMLARQCNLAREAEGKMMAERARCLKAVDDEPELPEDMPLDLRQDIILCFHLEDWGRIEEMFRATVRRTKKNIRKRIEEAAWAKPRLIGLIM